MFKYLKEAFWVRWQFSGFGKVPVNFLAVLAVIGLGFWHPWFWIGGLALELVFLAALVKNRRFRKLVNAPRDTQELLDLERKRKLLSRRLTASDATRFARLAGTQDEISKLYEEFAPDDFAAMENVECLERLRWTFLKLLTAQRHLRRTSADAKIGELRREITELTEELAAAGLPEKLRDTKRETLKILMERYQTHKERVKALEEIECDLERIEAQFDLAEEKAAMKARPDELSFSLDLASRILQNEDGPFGRESEANPNAESARKLATEA